MAPPPRDRAVLALDTGSPVVSAAVATAERVLAEATSTEATSSRRLLALIDEVLSQAGVRLGDLHAVCALQGPGSFTGLRVGLATILGFHQALGIPATALPTLSVLASLAADARVMAVVDALRGHWYHQTFDCPAAGPAAPATEACCRPVAELVFGGVEEAIGFGARALSPVAPRGVDLREPAALAGAGARLAAAADRWDPGRLVDPLYLRPPPARRAGSAAVPAP